MCAHGTCLLAGSSSAVAIEADLRDRQAILDNPAVRAGRHDFRDRLPRGSGRVATPVSIRQSASISWIRRALVRCGERKPPRVFSQVLVTGAGWVGLPLARTEQHPHPFCPQGVNRALEWLPRRQGGINERQNHHRCIAANGLGDDVEGVGVGNTGRELVDRVERRRGNDDCVRAAGSWPTRALRPVVATYRRAALLGEGLMVEEGHGCGGGHDMHLPVIALRQVDQNVDLRGGPGAADDNAQRPVGVLTTHVAAPT